MIAVLVLLSLTVVALTGALVVQHQAAARERAGLIDVIVSRTPNELRALRQASQPVPPEVHDFVADRDRQLRAMGLDPADVPALPDGF